MNLRFQAYAAIIMIASILTVPTLSTAIVQPTQFIPAATTDYDVVLAADSDDDYWNVYGTPAHNTVGSSVVSQFTDATHLYHGQMRFQLNITKDSTIVSAGVTMYDSYDIYAATGYAWRIAEDNVGSLEADVSVPSVDDSESATINYDGSIGWDTHTVTNLVQTQVNLAGWASGQYIGFQFNFTSLDPVNMKAWFDYSQGNNLQPYLNVTYEIVEEPTLRCKYYNNDDTSFTDYSTEADDSTSNDVPLLTAAPAQINDALYVGYTVPFRGLIFDIGTEGLWYGQIAWEYYNGSSWLTLDNVVDETNHFYERSGDGLYVTWATPQDWNTSIIDGDNRYWMRARVSAYASMGQQPKADQIYYVIYPQVTEGMIWSFDTFLIILGLIMVPSSSLYLVRGGRTELSTDKFFFALIIFFVGCGMFIGGIMP